ncbi:MAG: hypothetical protein ACI92E_001136 [Oceanicoccus sp.]|jgi:uncharacterized protein YaiL (DUF2058 family)
MAGSLQDQLLQAGLADKKKASKVKKDKQKQAKVQRRSKTEFVDDTKLQVQVARKEKVENDRLLNEKKNVEAEIKAVAAQVQQLIKVNRLPRNRAEIDYNFTDNKKIKKILVDKTMLEQLSKGRLAIVMFESKYEVVPTVIAEKIKMREPDKVIVCIDRLETAADVDDDDPYADYQIPDDLMW